MTILNVGFRVREAFFDRPLVAGRMMEGERKALSKFGSFVRTRARSSIRRPRRMRPSELPPKQFRIFEDMRERGLKMTLPFAPSKPGEPPRTPTGIYPDTILFAMDPQSESVVIGPVALARKGRDVPHTLEAGGAARFRGKTILIEPRPHMAPALEKERSQLPTLFEGIL